MKRLVLFTSHYGNTKQVAESMARQSCYRLKCLIRTVVVITILVAKPTVS